MYELQMYVYFITSLIINLLYIKQAVMYQEVWKCPNERKVRKNHMFIDV